MKVSVRERGRETEKKKEGAKGKEKTVMAS